MISRHKRSFQMQLMTTNWWWHSGMLMILASSFSIFVLLNPTCASTTAASEIELSQLIAIDAYNYNTIEDEDLILKDQDSFRLNYTKSYLYLSTNSPIHNILLQCKGCLLYTSPSPRDS